MHNIFYDYAGEADFASLNAVSIMSDPQEHDLTENRVFVETGGEEDDDDMPVLEDIPDSEAQPKVRYHRFWGGIA